MKKLLLKAIIFQFTCGILSAQTQKIVGKITDEDNRPVAYATIQVEQTSFGTITNIDGEFSLNAKPNSKVHYLNISYVGCTQQIVEIANPSIFQNIVLKDCRRELDEVVITPKDYELKILKAAISNIPKNYSGNTEVLKAFLRNTAFKDRDQAFYIIELSERIVKKSYEESSMTGVVQVLDNQKIEFSNLDSIDMRFYNGAHLGHWGDIVAKRESVLDVSSLKDYELKLTDTVQWDSDQLFEISFKPKVNSKVGGQGKVYVLSESYAIVKIILEYSEDELGNSFRELLTNYKRASKSYEVTYYHDNKTWRLGSIHYTTTFKKDGKILINLSDDLLVTGLDTVRNVPYRNRFDHRSIVLNEVERYDPNYWASENIILPSSETRQMIKQNSLRDDSPKSKKNRMLTVLQQLYVIYDLGIQNISISSNRVDFNDDLSFGVVSSKRWVWVYNSQLGYKMNSGFKIGLQNQASLENRRLSAYRLNIAYDINLNPTGRPIILTPSMGVGYLQISNYLGKVEEAFYDRKAQSTFDVSNSKVYIQQRSMTVLPSLTFLIEKSRRLKFFLKSGYNFSLLTQNGLLMEENQFFLTRKTLWYRESSAAVNFDSSKPQDFRNSWQLGIGVSISF